MTTATKSTLTAKALVAKARAMGYKKYVKGLVCETCGAEAFKFDCPGKPYIIACVNGHRSTIAKQAISASVKCKTEGCHATVHNLEITTNDGYCWKCRPLKAVPTQQEVTAKSVAKPKVKSKVNSTGKCITKGCNNSLPEGRKSYCYTCRPKSKATAQEEAQQVVM